MLSGLAQGSDPSLLISASLRLSACERTAVSGMHSSVSSVAYPNMSPWSPAPSSSGSPSWPSHTPWAISALCRSTASRRDMVL